MRKFNYHKQKDDVLKSLRVFEHSHVEYSLTKKKNISLFATTFSIFIKDLFNYQFSNDEKLSLGNHINSFQDKNTGLFVENKFSENPNFYCKTCLQLTTFCMSALAILDLKPKYKVNHMIKSRLDIYKYLNKVGVKDGKIGSGNFAMFLGIFLTQENLFDPKNKLID